MDNKIYIILNNLIWKLITEDKQDQSLPPQKNNMVVNIYRHVIFKVNLTTALWVALRLNRLFSYCPLLPLTVERLTGPREMLLKFWKTEEKPSANSLVIYNNSQWHTLVISHLRERMDVCVCVCVKRARTNDTQSWNARSLHCTPSLSPRKCVGLKTTR